MITKEEKARLRGLISETIVLLCKNGLSAQCGSEFSIDGVIGITMDTDELLLVAINQVVKKELAIKVTPKKSESKRASESCLTEPTDKRRRNTVVSPSTAPYVRECEATKASSKAHATIPDFQNTPEKRVEKSLRGRKNSDVAMSPTRDSLSTADTTRLDPRNKSPPPLAALPLMSANSIAYSPNKSYGEKPLDFSAEPGHIKQEIQDYTGEHAGESRDCSPPIATFASKDGVRSCDYLKMSGQATSPLVVQPEHMYSPYQLYSMRLQQQQALARDAMPGLVHASPGPAPTTPAVETNKVWEKAESGVESEQVAVDNLHRAAVYGHLGQSILRNEGCFVTSRIMTRKTGRKAKMVREVMLALTLPREHPEHIGTAREIGKNMLVFYKCPPDAISHKALVKYGIDVSTYSALFYSPLKTPPSQSILPSVLRDSPYQCPHYDDLLRDVKPSSVQNGPGVNRLDPVGKNQHRDQVQPFPAVYEDRVKSDNRLPSFSYRGVSASPTFGDRSCESFDEKTTAFDLRTSSQSRESVYTPNSYHANAENSHSYIGDHAPGSVCIEQEKTPELKQPENTEKSDRLMDDSDIENIDILNDSDQKENLDQSEDLPDQNKSTLLSFSGTFQEKTLDGDHQESFSSPLLGLQRMVSSHGSF